MLVVKGTTVQNGSLTVIICKLQPITDH